MRRCNWGKGLIGASISEALAAQPIEKRFLELKELISKSSKILQISEKINTLSFIHETRWYIKFYNILLIYFFTLFYSQWTKIKN